MPGKPSSTASLFDLIQPLAEPASNRAVMRAYRTNPINSFPARAYEEDRVLLPFFGRQSILTNRAEDIRHVLLDNADNYRRTRASMRIFRPLLGDGLLLATGAAWRAQRRTVAAAFVPSAVPTFAVATAEAMASAMTRLGDGDAAPFNLLEWAQALALDVAGRALVSLPLDDPLGQAIRRTISGYGLRFGRPSLLDMILPAWMPSPRDMGRRRVHRRFFALIDRLIAERRRRGDGPADDLPRCDDLFNLLTAAGQATGGELQAPLRDQLATLLVAGHETTAIALFWVLHLLAREPDWQQRIASEATAADLSPTGAGQAMPALVLSRAVVDEGMRLFPPASLILRQAIATDRLGDLAIKPGTVVIVAPWVLHRHRRLWRDPDAFIPERFLSGKGSIERFSYLPFGAGPRVCVGASLAVTEATIVLSTLLRRFRIEATDGKPVLPVGAVTTRPSRVPPYRFLPRG